MGVIVRVAVGDGRCVGVIVRVGVAVNVAVRVGVELGFRVGVWLGRLVAVVEGAIAGSMDALVVPTEIESLVVVVLPRSSWYFTYTVLVPSPGARVQFICFENGCQPVPANVDSFDI